MALTIISLNVYGLHDQDKRSGLQQWISSLPLNVDIICLQEAHVVSQAEASLWFESAGFTVASTLGSNCLCGLIILARPSCLMVNSWSHQDGRFLMCEFSCCNQVFRVVTVCAPNRNPDRNDLFDLVSTKIDVSIPTILCGDFDCVLDHSVDRRGAVQDDCSWECVQALSNLFDMAAFTDIWRYLHTSSSSFTWSWWH